MSIHPHTQVCYSPDLPVWPPCKCVDREYDDDEEEIVVVGSAGGSGSGSSMFEKIGKSQQSLRDFFIN